MKKKNNNSILFIRKIIYQHKSSVKNLNLYQKILMISYP